MTFDVNPATGGEIVRQCNSKANQFSNNSGKTIVNYAESELFL